MFQLTQDHDVGVEQDMGVAPVVGVPPPTQVMDVGPGVERNVDEGHGKLTLGLVDNEGTITYHHLHQGLPPLSCSV